MAETSEDRRRDYKRQLDELRQAFGQLEAELRTAADERDKAQNEVGVLTNQLEQAKKAVEVARVRGARDMANLILGED